jgi:hypothetical protein
MRLEPALLNRLAHEILGVLHSHEVRIQSRRVALDLLDALRLDKAAIVNGVVAHSHQSGDPPRVSGNV